MVDHFLLLQGLATVGLTEQDIDFQGVNGLKLKDKWKGGPQTYLGLTVAGFPNLFLLYGPNTNQGGNSIVYVLEAGARLVASAVRRAD